MFFNDTYTEVANRFSDWLLVSTTGTYVPNITLDCINRAVKSIALMAPRGWDYLTDNRYELTVANNLATLPVDCGVLLMVFSDTTGTGKANIYYDNSGSYVSGFRFVNNYAPATGFSGVQLQFFTSPQDTVYASYQKVLSDFTGSGTEYLPFPGELVLREAQRLRCADKNLADHWAMLKDDYATLLRAFKNQHQNSAMAFEIPVNDAFGAPIYLPSPGLMSASEDRSVHPTGFSNDRDYFRR